MGAERGLMPADCGDRTADVASHVDAGSLRSRLLWAIATTQPDGRAQLVEEGIELEAVACGSFDVAVEIRLVDVATELVDPSPVLLLGASVRSGPRSA